MELILLVLLLAVGTLLALVMPTIQGDPTHGGVAKFSEFCGIPHGTHDFGSCRDETGAK